jgi:hypothetical protein
MDPERLAKGEKASVVTLTKDKQAPIALKRSLSQSCDPHKGYISLELGSFEDTIGRVDPRKFGNQKGSLSTSFSYKVSAKISVDTVGLHRFSLEYNADEVAGSADSLGCVIVRIAILGGVKMVTVESPLTIRNFSDADLLIEVRDHYGLSVLWRSLAFKESLKSSGCLSVPADIVSFVSADSHLFSIIALPRDSHYDDESELISTDRTQFTPVAPPRPYSRASFCNGVVAMRNKSFRVASIPGLSEPHEIDYLNLCSIRIGSFRLEEMTAMSASVSDHIKIPETRMLLIRSPLAVYNQLPFQIEVQVKLADDEIPSRSFHDPKLAYRTTMRHGEWVDIGNIDCGQCVSWSGAAASQKIDLRVRLLSRGGNAAYQFPEWSSSTIIPADDGTMASIIKKELQIKDPGNNELTLSVATSKGLTPDYSPSCGSTKEFSNDIPKAARVVNIFVPFWLVDGTGLDLRYRTDSLLAGQVDAEGKAQVLAGYMDNENAHTLGLGELLDDTDLVYLPSRKSFQVFMIGGSDSSSRVKVKPAQHGAEGKSESPWSAPIPLTSRRSYYDTTVSSVKAEKVETFALRARFAPAPEVFGGAFGTKIVHIVCRYEVVNELGREIEIFSGSRRSPLTEISADGRLRPFHFDDSRPIRFRPKEFGWMWSGRFTCRHGQKDITIRLKHKLKNETLMVLVEFHAKQKNGTCIIVIRHAPRAPYRLENHSIHPIQFHQVFSSFRAIPWKEFLSSNSPDTVLLPYHHAEFAWDEPEFGQRSIAVQLADFCEQPGDVNKRRLGTFKLDQIVPGTKFDTENPQFTCLLDADGPTRVMRIVERASTDESAGQNIRSLGDYNPTASLIMTLKLSHGIGISVIDFTPQELVYLRLEDIVIERIIERGNEFGSASVGCLEVDNQLWITPYPVLLRLGSRLARRRNRRHCAIALSWIRNSSSSSGKNDVLMYERVELSAEPLMINIDGNLASLLINMVQAFKVVGSSNLQDNDESLSRNDRLKRLLGISELAMETISASNVMAVDDLYSAVDFMATAAIASKLRSCFMPPSENNISSSDEYTNEKPSNNNVMSERRRKYYIEKLRISAIAAKISWSGALPVKLPRVLRPWIALTFEGAPLSLNPFSCAHMYGSSDDLRRVINKHYFSLGRFTDILFGMVAKPLFLMKACMFTTAESFATGFELLSGSINVCHASLQKSRESIRPGHGTSAVKYMLTQVTDGMLSRSASVLLTFSSYASACSNLLHYKATSNRASGQLIRSRNPRLFANVEGQDLLVEYVEGENAGKAILSRVRTGCHLGEGYAYHIEGVYRATKTGEIDRTRSFIIMMTLERVLLLNGELNAGFCDVIWEACFADMVHLEPQRALHEAYTLIHFWHLRDSGMSSRIGLISLQMANDVRGMDTMSCQELFVPNLHRKDFMANILCMREDLVDSCFGDEQ